MSYLSLHFITRNEMVVVGECG